MRPHYTRHRVDTSQAEIIEALEKAGYEVHRQLPVDLLVGKHGQWFLLECKTPTGKRNPSAKWRKDQQQQNEFILRTGTPRVTSAEQALEALAKVVSCPR